MAKKQRSDADGSPEIVAERPLPPASDHAAILRPPAETQYEDELLLAEGPSPRALVASPLFVAMRHGLLVRFEEITRCPPEIQDTLVSVLSEKVMIVPELDGPDRVLHARPGFNVIGTANTRDR